jgi:ribosomal protein L40E
MITQMIVGKLRSLCGKLAPLCLLIEIEDKILCETAEMHNDFVRDFYEDLAKWAETPPIEFEELTNDEFQKILPGLETITVKPERWTGNYYTKRMEVLYDVMRGIETEGITFDEKKLTPKQASAVIVLFSEFLDNDDRSLRVPNGRDYLASSYDGGYWWCEKCGATTYDDAERCRKRKCPYAIEFKQDDED